MYIISHLFTSLVFFLFLLFFLIIFLSTAGCRSLQFLSISNDPLRNLVPICACNFHDSVCLPLWWCISRCYPVHGPIGPKFVCPSCTALLYGCYPLHDINAFRLLSNPLFCYSISSSNIRFTYVSTSRTSENVRTYFQRCGSVCKVTEIAYIGPAIQP